MTVYIGADHNGYELSKTLAKHLAGAGFTVVDVNDGPLGPADDFPVFATRVASAVLASDDTEARGILLCGSGQGMCMAANRYRDIRASLGYDEESVRSARNDDDSNVLCLPAHRLTAAAAEQLARLWLVTPFAAAPRYKRRIAEMDAL